MKTWRDIGVENAKISNEELRLQGQDIKLSSQTASLAKICADVSDIKFLLQELISHLKKI